MFRLYVFEALFLKHQASVKRCGGLAVIARALLCPYYLHSLSLFG